MRPKRPKKHPRRRGDSSSAYLARRSSDAPRSVFDPSVFGLEQIQELDKDVITGFQPGLFAFQVNGLTPGKQHHFHALDFHGAIVAGGCYGGYAIDREYSGDDSTENGLVPVEMGSATEVCGLLPLGWGDFPSGGRKITRLNPSH